MKKTFAIIALLFGLACGAQAQTFVGLNVNAGIEGTTGDTKGITLGAGADFAFAKTTLGTWGLFASHNFSLGTAGHTDLGIMHLPRDWRGRVALIWGAGVDLRSAVATAYGQYVEDDGTLRQSIGFRDRKGYGVVLRAGASFKRHFYITGSLAFGGFTSEKDTYTMSHTPAGLHYEGYDVTSEDRLYYCLNISLGFKF